MRKGTIINSRAQITILSDWPVEQPRNWVRLVNTVMTKKEIEGLQLCMARNRPYGAEQWQTQVAKRLGLSHTLRNEGRPKAAGSVPIRKN
jgi:putative transposase